MAQILKFKNGGPNKPKGKLIFNGIEYTADEDLINSLYEYGSTLPAKTQQQFSNIISSLEAGNTVTYGLNNIEGVDFDVNENQEQRMSERVGNGFGKERHARQAITALGGWNPNKTDNSSKYEIVDYSSPMTLTYNKNERGEFTKNDSGNWTLTGTPSNTAILNYLEFIPNMGETTQRILLPQGVNKDNISSWYSQNTIKYNEMIEDIKNGRNIDTWAPLLTSLGISINSEKTEEEIAKTNEYNTDQKQKTEQELFKAKGYDPKHITYTNGDWVVNNDNPLTDTSEHILTDAEKNFLNIKTDNIIIYSNGKLYQERDRDGKEFQIQQPGFNLGAFHPNYWGRNANLYKVGNTFYIRYGDGEKNWYGGYDNYKWVTGENIFNLYETNEPVDYKEWKPIDVKVVSFDNVPYITYTDKEGITHFLNMDKDVQANYFWIQDGQWYMPDPDDQDYRIPVDPLISDAEKYARGGKTKSNNKRKIDLEYPIEIAHYIAANVSTNKAAKKNKEGIRKSALALMPEMPTEIYPIYTDNGIDRAYDIQKQKLYNSKIPVSDAAIKTAYQLENEDKIIAIEQAKLAAKSENLNKYNQLLQSAQQQYAQQRDNIANKQRQIISTAIMQESAAEGNRRQNNWQSLDNLFTKLKETNALKQEKNKQYQTVIDYYDQLNELDKTLFETFQKLGGYDIVPDDKVQEYVNTNNWKGALETYAYNDMTKATRDFYKQSYINRLNKNTWFKKGGKLDEKMLLLKTRETYKTINQLNKEILKLFSKLLKNVD